MFRLWPLVARELYKCPPDDKYAIPNPRMTDCDGPQLTLPGCKQHKELGKFFRKAYGLNSIPNLEKRVKLISTSSQRTVHSGKCFFNGLLKGTAIPATGLLMGLNFAFSNKPLFSQGSLDFPTVCAQLKDLAHREN
eukprot:m.125983 g.125983  ORF g.125983 m.125983 type:complete len:136 (+) comp37887_c0_seq2:337-744(+)